MRLFKLATVVAVAFTFAASASQAQNAGAGALAGSASQSGALAGSQSSLTINNTGAAEVRSTVSGSTTSRIEGSTTARIETAPDVMAPSLGSGHPCMINTSVGFSVIGGGASGGSGKVDVGCMMMRSNNSVDNAAGRIYYAAKDETACKAWRAVGAISPDSICTGAEKRRKGKRKNVVVATKSTPVAASWRKCSFDAASNKITWKPKGDRAASKAACLTSLGY